jgi:hypothetical protein
MTSTCASSLTNTTSSTFARVWHEAMACARAAWTARAPCGSSAAGCRPHALRRRYARSVAGPSQEAPFGGIWARQTSGPAASGILNDEAVPGPPGWAGQGQLAGKQASRC